MTHQHHASISEIETPNNPTPTSNEDINVRVRVSPEPDAANAEKSLLSEFDDYVARAERENNLRHGLEVGDMVWGKVKSHPWWPGHIYNEALASPNVLRTKRERHVLVAFFGDSSYGWFHPSELISFHENFDEKSRQLSSRNFLKAVQEAVDEASRRCGVGLVCGCRNSESFRATDVPGYFSVHLKDYEPGVYSEGEIKKARNGFRPSETLAFVRELALAPHGGDRGSVGFAMNKATLLGFRRAVFEPNDETYAQAFGVNPLSRSYLQDDPLYQPVTVRHPATAPLSGPLVVAKTLGGEKKDKYLLERRDEPSNSFQSASREETPDAAGQYVFQKRAPAMSMIPQILEKHEDTGFINQDGNAKLAVEDQVQPEGKESSEPDNVASKSMIRPDLSGDMALPSMVVDTSPTSHLESLSSIDVKHNGNIKLSGPLEDFLRTEQELVTVADGSHDTHQVKSASNVGCTSPVEAKHKKISVDGVAKKVEVHKRPADDLNSETSAIGEKKKKKKKKRINIQPTSGHLEKHSSSGKSVHLSGKLIGKPVSTGSAPREDLHAEPAKVDDSANNLQPIDIIAEAELELPQLLGDMKALALDPFHGVKRGTSAVVWNFFLRFRSLVYQKSLPLPPPSENEAPEVSVTKSPPSVEESDGPEDNVRASPLVKPIKHIVRPYDPTKSGRKRALSDRQEEIASKRLKKIKDLKALTAEKKAAGHKASEAQRGEGKESMVQAPPMMVKPDSTRKVERQAKPVEPTMLVIKFPPQTSLPSVAELKARFARFGPIDQSGLRVFWKSSTCRVVFLHKVDAQAAYKYGVANQSLFGNVGVRYFLREYGDSAPEVSEAAKSRGDDGAIETLQVKDPAVVQRLTSVSVQQPLPQPVIQPKSILKKSTGDDLGQVAGNGGSSKGTPRVKFKLGGEESSRGEQLMVGDRNNFNNTSFADGGAPSPVAMDFNSKSVQNVFSQPSLPNLPLPSQFTKIPQHNLHNSEMVLRNSPNFINTTASATATTIDISQQMISLLIRCSDVVTNLTGLSGYVPYHPL